MESTISSNELKQFIEKIEHLTEEKSEIQDHINSIYADAKAKGFLPKIMRMIIRKRKMKKEELREEQELLDLYSVALGLEA